MFMGSLPDRPGSQQRHFLQAPKDAFVCSVLIYVQRNRGFTTRRYINLRLLTYLLHRGEGMEWVHGKMPILGKRLLQNTRSYEPGAAEGSQKCGGTEQRDLRAVHQSPIPSLCMV